LRDTFAVQVDVVGDLPTLSLSAQVALVRNYTVLITPAGGLSFASAFMAPGSAAVYLGYFEPQTSTSEHIELYIWTQALAVHNLYYHVHANETTVRIPPGPTPQPIQRTEHHRNYGDIRIVLPRMGRVVYDALRSAEVAFGWRNSFSRKHASYLHRRGDN
jgi:hypothetical protein